MVIEEEKIVLPGIHEYDYCVLNDKKEKYLYGR